MNEYSTHKRYAKNDTESMIWQGFLRTKTTNLCPLFQAAGNAMLITLRPLKQNHKTIDLWNTAESFL